MSEPRWSNRLGDYGGDLDPNQGRYTPIAFFCDRHLLRIERDVADEIDRTAFVKAIGYDRRDLN